MANPTNSMRNFGEKLETPLAIRQVETHLVFGPLSRHVPVAYIAFGISIISLIGGFFATNKPIGQYIGSILDKVIFLIVPLLMLRMTYRQQAILAWIAVKFALGIVAFMMLTIGSVVSFQRGEADAWPNLCLGVIWIPSIEFLPKITPYQRYVTLTRIVLSVPCIYFGVKSGNWHWSSG